MSEETIDYGQVTGMVHSTESFGAVDGPWDSFYCLSCKAVRCVASTAITQILGLWKPINLVYEQWTMF